MSTYDQSQFRAIFESEFTYLNGLLRNTRRYANRTALTCPLRNRSWTYTELNHECNCLANALAADGLGEGEVVAYVIRRDPSLTAKELEKHCLTHPMLARYKRPLASGFRVAGFAGRHERRAAARGHCTGIAFQ